MSLDLEPIRARNSERKPLLIGGGVSVRLSRPTDGSGRTLDVYIVSHEGRPGNMRFDVATTVNPADYKYTVNQSSPGDPIISGGYAAFYDKHPDLCCPAIEGLVVGVNKHTDPYQYQVRFSIHQRDWGSIQIITPSVKEDIDALIAEVEKLRRGR